MKVIEIVFRRSLTIKPMALQKKIGHIIYAVNTFDIRFTFGNIQLLRLVMFV